MSSPAASCPMSHTMFDDFTGHPDGSGVPNQRPVLSPWGPLATSGDISDYPDLGWGCYRHLRGPGCAAHTQQHVSGAKAKAWRR